MRPETHRVRLLALLIALVAAAYVPFLGGGLLTDDFVHLQHLSRVSSLHDIVAQPDAFGFYRPATQASLALDAMVHGDNAAGYRATNLALHAMVLALAGLVATMVLQSAEGGMLAALGFALTPKAHPAAVSWISARGELLMAFWSLIAVAAFIKWSRDGGWWWLLTAAAYLLAVTSKETALLLPLLVLLPGLPQTWRRRLMLFAGLAAIAIAVFAWRAHVGALLPATADAHYTWSTPIARWLRNARNYGMRMLPGPLALVVIAGCGSLIIAGVRPARPRWGAAAAAVLAFAVAWVAVFIAPVLPVALRSELYLYLPVFGLSVAAAWLVGQCMGDRVVVRPIMVGVLVAALGSYQVWRSLEHHRHLVFSQALVEALAGNHDLRTSTGTVTVVPADAATGRYLRDAIGDYLPVVLDRVVGAARWRASVQYAGRPPVESETLRLVCSYRDGVVTLQP